MDVDFEAGAIRQVIDPELLRPSHHRTAWTKCYVIKKDKTFMMFTEATSRFLLAGCLVGDEFRISQYDKFLQVHDPSVPNSGQRHPMGRYICVLRRAPGQTGFTLYSFGCENCDNRLGRYSCEPLMSPLGMDTALQAGGSIGMHLRTPTNGSSGAASAAGTPKAVVQAVSTAVNAAAAPILSALRGGTSMEDGDDEPRSGWARGSHRRNFSGGSMASAADQIESGAALSNVSAPPREGSGSQKVTIRTQGLRTPTAGGLELLSPGAASPALFGRDDVPRQRLAEISQRIVHLEKAGVDIRCLTVVLPKVFDDLSRVVWCPRNRRGSGAGCSPRVLLLHSAASATAAGGAPSRATAGGAAAVTRSYSVGSEPSPHASALAQPSPARQFGTAGPADGSSTPGGAVGLPPTGPRAMHHRMPSSGYPIGIAAGMAARALGASASAANLTTLDGAAPGGGLPSAMTPTAGAPSGTGKPPAGDAPFQRSSSDGGATWTLSSFNTAHGLPSGADSPAFPRRPATPGLPVGMAAPAGVITRGGPTATAPQAPFARPTTPSALPAGVPTGLNGNTVASASPPSGQLHFPPTARSRTSSDFQTPTPSIIMDPSFSCAPAPETPVPSSPHGMATAASPSLFAVPSNYGFPSAAAVAAAARGSVPGQSPGVSPAMVPQTAPSTLPPDPALAPPVSMAPRRASSTGTALAGLRRSLDGSVQDSLLFENRMPEWNDSLGSLTMKFLGGRIGDSSSKNFLMEMLPPADADPLNDTGSTVSAHTQASASSTPSAKRIPSLQFGKIKNGKFSCDFRYPYCPVQAFGVFLSSFHWTLKGSPSSATS